jgi:cephalosporin hydroxylase
MNSPDPIQLFFEERRQDVAAMGEDEELRRKSLEWMLHANRYKYGYQFTWLGRPIIRYPGDIVMQQELIWSVRPDLIIETGVAHGGSIVLSASLLELIGEGEVVAVDIDIRAHNRREIERHPLSRRITLVEGDSTDDGVFRQVKEKAAGKKRVMVYLDSNHTHDHVLRELQLYADLVTEGSYCVVLDTIIESFPKGNYPDRPWDVGNNPMTAVQEFLGQRNDFEIAKELSDKVMLTEGSNGYLRRRATGVTPHHV